MERACLALQAPTTHSPRGRWEANSCTGRNGFLKAAAGGERTPKGTGWVRLQSKFFTASGAAAANEQVPQARVRAEEQGKDQSTAINRGRRNRGDTDPCKLQDGKTIPNTAPGTHAWESVMQSQVQTKLSPHSEIQ